MTAGPESWAAAVAAVRSSALRPDAAVDGLLAAMTDAELLGLLDGDAPGRTLPLIPALLHRRVFTAGAVPRLGVPGVRFSDGPRGTVLGRSTSFPVTMARAATWDPDLEREVGRAIGAETRAQGANYSASVCVNLLRFPQWGRAQECYGEDPVLTGAMGAAMVRGVREHAMACVKHYALNSMDDARFEVDVVVDEHALHEVYLPHFRATVEAGADSMMSAYNAVNGRWLDVHRELLTDVLRDEWGFHGFVTSDWVFGTHDPVESLTAGMDVEMPLRLSRARELPGALASGRLERGTVLAAGRRILRTVLQHEAQREPEAPARSIVAGAAHRALARQVAARSMVLLRNEPVGARSALPLPPSIGTLAVLGRLSARPNLGDHGSSRVRPPSADTALDALRAALPGAVLRHSSGRDPALAAALARTADAAVVVVGLDPDDEGESVVTAGVDVGVLGRAFRSGPLRFLLGALARAAALLVRGGDRTSLALPAGQARLVEAVAAANPRTVVVLIGGSAIVPGPWAARVPALLHAWYPGMAGGAALADVLTGAAEPGGRLPFTIPTDAAHLPPFHPHARRVVYDAWWGQRMLDRDGRRAAFPFGWGLGYSTFETALLAHRLDADGGAARVRLRNTGERDGATVVQLYAADAAAARPVPQLVGFRRVALAAGEEVEIEVPLDPGPLRERDPATRRWSFRAGEWVLVAAQHGPRDLAGAAPLHLPADA